MSDTPPSHVGERVTFVDEGGEERRAIVVSPVNDADYVSLVVSDNGELGEDYTHRVTAYTSVYHEDSEYADETLIYREGWDDE